MGYLSEYNDIDSLQKRAHQTSKAKGWWDGERSIPEQIALMHSELSEALEAFRIGDEYHIEPNGKPEGIYVELADCVIRIMDTLEANGQSLYTLLLQKMNYNDTRPHRHGGKKA